jgi:hypothetical protein
VRSFIQQWDRLCAGGAKGLQGNEGEGGWRGRDGWAWLDCLPCKLSTLFSAHLMLIWRHRVQLPCL